MRVAYEIFLTSDLFSHVWQHASCLRWKYSRIDIHMYLLNKLCTRQYSFPSLDQASRYWTVFTDVLNIRSVNIL